ncbi:uroporphyrinogen decarboxylase [Helcobacillus massiliensis]|uniref:Uroporphyrinogen decarboxylase n=1 Tax=Helcobacillus massiliensis TaxID=521392 RepID=A0A839QS80_9MICO|nr:uroporphyrinogen decarboxylase [Helcobacillus massiliensis]MBB3023164.1 uroporphyrinogen decarboxylase [Helcobacillus massiliensis]
MTDFSAPSSGPSGAPSPSPAESPLVKRLAGRGAEVADAPPSVWFMRQAGRSLPEYKQVRGTTGMLESCLIPEMAAEITLQPVRRHKVDAGIFFSDIMTPLKIAGLGVHIEPGIGPVFEEPISSEADIRALPPVDDVIRAALDPIREAVRITVEELGSTPLIGFCGAPFTVASYMVEGRPSRDHLTTRSLMTREPELWAHLAEWVANLSGEFLRAQVEAGASAVQLFDSWAGSLSERVYREHVLPHSERTLGFVADLDVPRTHFGVGTGHMLPAIADAGATCVGVDHRIELSEAIDLLPGHLAVQGNIDPSVLFSSEEVRFAEAKRVVEQGRAAAGQVVNLGHGVPPTTDPQVLTDLVAHIHSL